MVSLLHSSKDRQPQARDGLRGYIQFENVSKLCALIWIQGPWDPNRWHVVVNGMMSEYVILGLY